MAIRPTGTDRQAKSGGLAYWASLGRRACTERGQSLVEFALVLPIFLVLLFALVDFGRAYFTWLTLTNAAREGARAASLQDDASSIDSAIYDSMCNAYPNNCSINSSNVSITLTNVQGTTGSEATVSLSYPFSFVTPISPFLQLIGGSALANPTITAHATMRLE